LRSAIDRALGPSVLRQRRDRPPNRLCARWAGHKTLRGSGFEYPRDDADADTSAQPADARLPCVVCLPIRARHVGSSSPPTARFSAGHLGLRTLPRGRSGRATCDRRISAPRSRRGSMLQTPPAPSGSAEESGFRSEESEFGPRMLALGPRTQLTTASSGYAFALAAWGLLTSHAPLSSG